MKNLTLLVLSLILWTGVNAQSPVKVDEVYKKNLDNWQKSMTRWKLRNFVPLIGLDLLQEGKNTFGRAASNDIVVNSPNAPEYIGVIIKSGKELRYVNTHEIEAELEGQPITDLSYTFDEDRNSEMLRCKFIKWYIQYVEDDFFLRLVDDTSPLVSSFEPYDYFPANEEFIIEGKYKPYKKAKVIPLNNVISLTQRYEHSGKVSFKFKGKKYELEVLQGSMIMFADQTNGETTFPHGRYVRVKSENGKMVIDFNYSFSPPRAVSLYTTCDLPPSQNHLPFAITAGEQYENTGQDIFRKIK